MTESAVEKIARLATETAGQSSLSKILSLSGATDNNDDDVDVDPASEAAEANDNEEMLRTGVHMNAAGHASYGSVTLGHVRPHKSGSGYVGMHPSGLVTSKHPTRAKAAMALLNLHQYVPKDAKKQVKHLNLSASPLDQVVNLAADAPGNGKKPYGNVTYADPKNGKYPIDTEERCRAAWGYINHPKDAAKYPLNGVTLASVKSRIEAACKKFGIDISDSASK